MKCMKLKSGHALELNNLLVEIVSLWYPHEETLGEVIKHARFSVHSDRVGLYCSYCPDKEKSDILSLSFDELSTLCWASLCNHLPNIVSIIACIDNKDLASTLMEIIAIRQPRKYEFLLERRAVPSIREALTIGMAYSSFQKFITTHLYNFERGNLSAHAEIIHKELSNTKTYLDNIHQSTIGSEHIRNLLRKEASSMVKLSDNATMGWIILGYMKLSTVENDNLKAQTVARALQASFAPKSLHEDELVCIPFWVVSAIRSMAPDVIKSKFHTSMPIEVLRSAETLWREANGGLFADFDESVIAARLLN